MYIHIDIYISLYMQAYICMYTCRWSENGTSFAKLLEPIACARPESSVVGVGPIYNNGEAATKVSAWLAAHPEYAGWTFTGEWYRCRSVVGGVSPNPSADVGGMSSVPAQMWAG